MTSSIINLEWRILHLHIFLNWAMEIQPEVFGLFGLIAHCRVRQIRAKVVSITQNHFLNYAKVFNGIFCLRCRLKKGSRGTLIIRTINHRTEKRKKNVSCEGIKFPIFYISLSLSLSTYNSSQHTQWLQLYLLNWTHEKCGQRITEIILDCGLTVNGRIEKRKNHTSGRYESGLI